MFERTSHDERASELLKLATEKKKAKDWDGAIAALKEAYQEIAQSQLGYSVETFIRLPQFLQSAGRSKEAWKAFNELLFRGSQTQLEGDNTDPMERSILFDKMRLFLQREKREQLADIFSIFAAVSWRVGLHRQDRVEELAELSSDEDAAEMISTLSAYSSPGTIKQLCDAVTNELRGFPTVDYNKMGLAMETVIASAKKT